MRAYPAPVTLRLPGAALRASDAEREQALASLRRHYTAGRLDEEGLERRAERVLRARHRGEVRRALAGLPSDRPFRAAVRAYGFQRRLLPYHAATFATVNGALVGVWELAGAGLFWPAVVLAPTSVALAGHGAASRGLRRWLRLERPPRRRRLRHA